MVGGCVGFGLLLSAGFPTSALAGKRRAAPARKKSPPVQARINVEEPPRDRTRIEDEVNLGRAAMEASRYFNAERAFTAALSLDPRHREALTGAAEAAFENAHYEQARGWAERAVVEAETVQNFTLLGHANAKLGDLEKAIAAYNKALALHPSPQDSEDLKEYLRRARSEPPRGPSQPRGPSRPTGRTRTAHHPSFIR